eukprot:gene4213-5987_t
MISVKFKYDRDNRTFELPKDGTINEMFQLALDKFGLNSYEFDMLAGYPPSLVTGYMNDELSKIGITHGTSVQIRLSEKKKSIYQELINLGYSRTIAQEVVSVISNDLSIENALDTIKQIENNSVPQDRKVIRRIIPADNSCLFNSISYLINSSNQINYREIVVEMILSNPDKYSSVVLGKPVEEYLEWILNPDKWGGEIEISVLSDYLLFEIAAVDIQTNNVYIYGEGKQYAQRIYLLYDGIHYDALVKGYDESLVNELKQFAIDDDVTLQEIKDFAANQNKMKKFVNLSGCSLQCKVCNEGFIGQLDAVAHAKLTGHQNFGQVDS